MSVPPNVLKREIPSTINVEPLLACVLMYTLSWNELALPTRALASNVLVHTPVACAEEASPCSTYCCPAAHPWHSSAVLSSPVSTDRLGVPAKCVSK